MLLEVKHDENISADHEKIKAKTRCTDEQRKDLKARLLLTSALNVQNENAILNFR